MSREQWPPWPITSLRSNLDDLARLVDTTAVGTPHAEHLPWLARLLVVRTSGYLEQTVHEVTRAHIAHRSGGVVRSFAHSWLERSRNPRPDALEQLVGRFDASWAEELTSMFEEDDQELRRELSFLVDRRNKIAHGLNEGLTPRKALTLIPVAETVADWFILRLNPTRQTPSKLS